MNTVLRELTLIGTMVVRAAFGTWLGWHAFHMTDFSQAIMMAGVALLLLWSVSLDARLP